MQLILVWLVAAVALIVVSRLVPGFDIRDFGTALVASLVVGLANAVLWPVLLLLKLPLDVMTLGLASFVISVLSLKLTSMLVPAFRIDGWFPAVLGAVVLALLNALVNTLFPF